ncbi:MAG: heat-inducible transcriptional repressor HrcA [Actinomycetota bacterium]|jgi:heat-inducible transcriptional repressor
MDERKFAVLRAIIEDYVATQEPIGSKSLVERHSLKVSPATVRNEMAVLEDEGYIVQPHTSAGRIPTDKGYRTFVDRLNEVRALSSAESKAITQVLQGAVDLDDVMQKTVKLLAQLTGQVSVVQYPTLSNSVVKHIDLISVTDSRIMIVLVANSGRLEQTTVELPKPISAESLDSLRAKLKSTITDKKFSEVSNLTSGFSKVVNPSEVRSVEIIVEKVNLLTRESADQKVMVGGAGNLARLDPAFSKNLLPVLDEIEENVVVLKLLGEMASTDDIFVRIGHENKVSNLHSASIVATGYSSGDSLSKLGIVGPTRMDYPGTMAAVGAVARYLGRILGNS